MRYIIGLAIGLGLIWYGISINNFVASGLGGFIAGISLPPSRSR